MLRAGVIDEMELQSALGEQKKWGSRLGLVLIRLGYATEQQIVQAVASQLSVPVATLDGKKIPEKVLGLVPYDYADAHTCLPLFMKEEEGVETLYLAMDDPSNLDVLDDLGFRTGLRVKPVVVATSEISAAIDRFYRHIERKVEASDDRSAYFGTTTELVPSEGDDGFDVFSFVGPSDRLTQKDSADDEDSSIRNLGGHAGNSQGSRPPVGALTHQPAKQSSDQPTTKSVENLEAPATESRVDENSTRRILHALTQIMIEKGLVTREEIFYRVQSLAAREEEDRKEES